MTWIHGVILIPLIFAIFVPFFYKQFTPRIHTGWFVVLAPITLFIILLQYIPVVARGETILQTVSWIPSLGINFTTYVDGLSLIFALLITGIGALVIIYSIYYLSSQREALHNFYVYLLIFMGAMLGLVFSDNVIVLYVFWEMTSISSFLLIAYWYQRKNSRYGAQKAMLITIAGGLSMLAALLMLSIMTDTYSIREMIAQLDVVAAHPLFLPAIILLLIGAFTKSAQFPFHIWLPDAMEAPTPVSAYLHSATMVKAGIYLVARFTPLFGGSMEWFWIVSVIGLITLIVGALKAVKQTDLKALLAYSTISQLGLIMTLLGLGSAALYFGYGEESDFYAIAILAALFHLVNHSTFKGCLFMVVGIIDHETGTRDISKLGGLMNIMPISFTLALIGSFSMAGLPPFNGFLSKEMFFTSLLRISDLSAFNMESAGILFISIAWIASVFTFVYCMIFVFKTFRGTYQPERLEKAAHEAPFGMLFSPIVLAALVILIFFFPNIIGENLLEPAMTAVLPTLGAEGYGVNIYAWHGFVPELGMTAGVVVFGSLLYLTYNKWSWIQRVLPEWFSLTRFYDVSLESMENYSNLFTKKYMTGYTRDYLMYIFGFLVVLMISAMTFMDVLSFDISTNAPISLYELILVLVIAGSALGILFSKSRFTSIIFLGVMGYLVALMFMIFRAPDLALTQLVVETVTVALFLLCFYHLPEFKKENSPVRFRAANLVISLGVGTTMTLIALSANGSRLFEPISIFFENSYELAGARNIVNAILVDFRGMDTFLEILVLLIAGLGVYSLVKIKSSGRDSN